MSLRETWRGAPVRTNRVRVVGLVVGLLAGVPVGGFAAILMFVGLDGLTDDPAWGVRAWAFAGVVTLGVSLRTLLVMPELTPRARAVGLVGALLGVLAAAPTLWFPLPWKLGGIALVVAGVTLAWELRRQAREVAP